MTTTLGQKPKRRKPGAYSISSTRAGRVKLITGACKLKPERTIEELRRRVGLAENRMAGRVEGMGNSYQYEECRNFAYQLWNARHDLAIAEAVAADKAVPEYPEKESTESVPAMILRNFIDGKGSDGGVRAAKWLIGRAHEFLDRDKRSLDSALGQISMAANHYAEDPSATLAGYEGPLADRMDEVAEAEGWEPLLRDALAQLNKTVPTHLAVFIKFVGGTQALATSLRSAWVLEGKKHNVAPDDLCQLLQGDIAQAEADLAQFEEAGLKAGPVIEEAKATVTKAREALAAHTKAMHATEDAKANNTANEVAQGNLNSIGWLWDWIRTHQRAFKAGAEKALDDALLAALLDDAVAWNMILERACS